MTAELESRLSALHVELEHSREKEEKAIVDNRQLSEKISTLEKEAASLTLELKAAQARYNQEVVAHQETERSRILSKEEANLEVVKGNFIHIMLKFHVSTIEFRTLLSPNLISVFFFFFFNFQNDFIVSLRHVCDPSFSHH